MAALMLYDLLRDSRGYHIVPRGSAHVGVFICTMPEWFCREMNWLPA